jgi:hypothetical protein
MFRRIPPVSSFWRGAMLRATIVFASMFIAASLGNTRLHAQDRQPATTAPGSNNLAGTAIPQSTLTENSRQQALAAYGNLPLTFIENHGQMNHDVRYYGRRGNFGVYFTPKEIMFALEKPSQPSGNFVRTAASSGGFSPRVIPTAVSLSENQSKDQSEDQSNSALLALRFLQANPRVTLAAEERAPGEINYFRGNDPAHWQTGLAQYSQVVYRELWQGIDLKLREQEKSLKYEFRVHAGAQVSNIRLAYTGASGVRLDDSGTLLIESPAGLLRDAPPVAYQEIAGVRVPVESHYVLNNATGEYGFTIGAGYQPSHDLIIDPGVSYSTFLGGTSHEIGSGIAVDAAGNAYIVGITQSPDFTTTAGAFDRTGAASTVSDVFVAKLNPTGTALVYATFIGGSDFDFGRAIAIDAAGNAYITGQTKSSDFPTTKGAFDTTFNIPANCPRCAADNYDAFVTKLNASGSALVYSTFLGGAQDIDDALGIAVDSLGSAYVTGETASPDFPITPGAFRTVKNASDDAYVTKLNPAGSALVYSTFIGGSQVEFGVRIAVDASHNAYVLGNTSSPDFPTTPGAFDTSFNGAFDVFVLKLNAAGTALVYSTFLGGSGFDSAGGLAIDSAGNAYVSGGTASSDFPITPGAFQTVSPNSTGGGGFVTKLNPTGSALVYSTFLGDAGCNGLALTPTGNVWVTGSTTSQTFPTTPDAFQGFLHVNGATSSDGFITELNATGTAILYSTYLGGTNTDYGTDLALDSTGNVYVTGETMSSDFPTTAGAFDRVFKGELDIFWGDAFITKLALNGTPPPPPPLPTIAIVTPAAAQLVGGNSDVTTVSLTTGAQGSGAVVSLTSSNPAVLSVPATLTIPTGAQSGTFSATTSVVTANTPVTITASYNSSSKPATVTVLPAPGPAVLSSIGFFPNVVTGGTAALAILGLTNPAPAGGFTVTLSTNNPVALVPATATVPAGETTGSFSVPTSTVTASTGLTVFAMAGGVTQLAPLTVNPAAPPVTTVALAVSATGRSGQSITSSPAGISVAVGSSTQASFTSGTSITLTVSGGKTAIWTGGCSSGGSKTSACTLTLNAAATVTANVQ